VYSTPPGTDGGPPGVTIASTPYNVNVHDVEADLNAARPIIAGGTGATNATQARDNLDAEVASAQVTNYSSHTFEAGSFYSLSGATDAPTAHDYSGTCWIIEKGVTDDIYLAARNQTESSLYLRTKTGGVWSAWMPQTAPLDDRYVNLTGDTMTGNLTIDNADPVLTLKKTATDHPAAVFGVTSIWNRWALVLGDSTHEAGSETGSNFALYRYKDDGTTPKLVMGTARSTGNTVFYSDGGIVSQYTGTPTGGAYKFGNGTPQLYYNGTAFSLDGGALTINGATSVYGNFQTILPATPTQGVVYFGNTGTAYLQYGGAEYVLNGGKLTVGSDIVSSRGGAPTTGKYVFGNTTSFYIYFDGAKYQITAAPMELGAGFYGRAGFSGAYNTNIHNFDYGTGYQAWLNTTNMGNITLTSDYRIKKDVIDLPGTWETVKALRPIRYTQAQFTPPSEIAYRVQRKAEAAKTPAVDGDGKAIPYEEPKPMFEADDIERWGFVAHELQATLVPSASTGVKDSPDTIQSPNPWTVIAALTRALQEAMSRIEALEAAQATP
jgi:hypothetical protein